MQVVCSKAVLEDLVVKEQQEVRKQSSKTCGIEGRNSAKYFQDRSTQPAHVVRADQ